MSGSESKSVSGFIQSFSENENIYLDFILTICNYSTTIYCEWFFAYGSLSGDHTDTPTLTNKTQNKNVNYVFIKKKTKGLNNSNINISIWPLLVIIFKFWIVRKSYFKLCNLDIDVFFYW